MWNRLKVTAVGSMVVILATTTACGSNHALPKNSAASPSPSAQQENTGSHLTHNLSQDGQGLKMLGMDDAVVPIKAIGSINYVSAKDLIQVLKFQSGWDASNQKLLIGDNDANYELIMNSNKASKEGNELSLSQPFIKEGDTAYIPISALGDLFQEDMSYEVRDAQLRIHPSSIITMEHEDDPDPRGNAAELEFGDDPADPFKGEKRAVSPANSQVPNEGLQVWSPNSQEEAIPVLKNIDINAMIDKGKQYLGVKYLFGTKPYPQTGKFDCSTFTQYIYGKYGIKLPRVAREQATAGTLVSRKSLRKGDLMFFYVPGRFKSNKTIGHVGIYIGNMQMLHASPKPKDGVQITNIDKAYWKATFLRAKRIAE
ncbi:peptidoglycan endopeptidase [Paenibacillus sp. SYP-B3998]|uniref:Peptidoglycan endopeptidase n=1 Tax=Paenibacillus sp. SYP-B3998 TaxID=2678564 RepID=A0A6G4A1V4_9BACL|nr:C40 family peptidase [Paenibacillus sp. SYP-B3998]NEW07809.1 peptidoglycan endopeptidase [Paenibacillus sp. SYP-B3998]